MTRYSATRGFAQGDNRRREGLDMEIPTEPGATGAVYDKDRNLIEGGWDAHLKEAFEARFGPIPSGLAIPDVNKAFTGPQFPFMGSVGAWPPPAAPEPPLIAPEHEAYLAKVRAEGDQERRLRAAEKQREVLAAKEKAFALINGLEINATGEGRIIDHDYGAWDLEIGGKGLIASLIELDLDNLENEELGVVSVSIKFHGKDQP